MEKTVFYPSQAGLVPIHLREGMVGLVGRGAKLEPEGTTIRVERGSRRRLF